MNSKNYGWPTSRCFPRTMNDAFKNNVDNAQWLYPPEKNFNWRNTAMLAVAIWLWIGLAYYLVSL